ncbi:hypothetical protein [Nocardia sp. NPDC051570]|uniref:hypothetical protein n=1 Tax=Nocardia sp. NPDC051570 TaxID=3364324 RepID=UPI003790D09C
MNVVTDTEILVALAPLHSLVAERAAMARVVARLPRTADPRELAEYSRCGNRMAALDTEILRTAAEALRGIGLSHAAWAVEAVADNRLGSRSTR